MTQEFDQAMNELKYALRRYRRPIIAIVLIIGGLWLAGSTFYTVKADEEGVVLRFGKHIASTPPGLHMKYPWPVDRAIVVPTRRVKTLEFGFATLQAGRQTRYRPPTAGESEVARMLTGDLNLAHVEWIVQYRISDAKKFLFAIGGARSQTEAVEDTIRDVSETVVRELVGDVSVDEVLTTGRDQIAVDAKRDIQEHLDGFDCGIQIVTVKLQTVSPPEPVKDAFDSVNRARQNKEKAVNEARGDRNRRIPEARGKRDRAIAEAEGYHQLVTKSATGRASAFLSKLKEYKRAPEVTRARLYLEAMEEVLGQVGGIVIIDESIRGILPFLNLDDSGSTSSAGKGDLR